EPDHTASSIGHEIPERGAGRVPVRVIILVDQVIPGVAVLCSVPFSTGSWTGLERFFRDGESAGFGAARIAPAVEGGPVRPASAGKPRYPGNRRTAGRRTAAGPSFRGERSLARRHAWPPGSATPASRRKSRGSSARCC